MLIVEFWRETADESMTNVDVSDSLAVFRPEEIQDAPRQSSHFSLLINVTERDDVFDFTETSVVL